MIVTTRNDDLKLLPGMTANVTFVISRKENVVRLPNRALRFLPPGASRETSGGNSRAARARARLDRMAKALKLTDDQKKQVADAYREMFEKIRAMRSGGGAGGNMRAQFRSLRQKLMSRLRQILSPEQFRKMADMRRGGRRGGWRQQARGRAGRVWIVAADGTPRAIRIRIGITDGQHTELMRGGLKPGDRVIIGIDRSGRRRTSPRLRL